MKTWYCVVHNEVYLITAENCEMAKMWLFKYHKILVENKDLFNVVTHSRWCKHVTG